MNKLIKYFILFSVGGIAYFLCELLWRGWSHRSMYVLGGICFVLVGIINERSPRSIPLVPQMLAATGIITLAELIAGIILNLRLSLNIWDYSDMPLNLMGQICVPYMLLWFFLSPLCIILDDYLRCLFFDEEKPHYTLF